jgi:hypothetical protein
MIKKSHRKHTKKIYQKNKNKYRRKTKKIYKKKKSKKKTSKKRGGAANDLFTVVPFFTILGTIIYLSNGQRTQEEHMELLKQINEKRSRKEQEKSLYRGEKSKRKESKDRKGISELLKYVPFFDKTGKKDETSKVLFDNNEEDGKEFSNLYQHEFTYHGEQFQTAKQAFDYEKNKHKESSSQTVKGEKEIWYKRVPSRIEKRLQVLASILFYKFSVESLKQKLLSVFSELLIEHSSHTESFYSDRYYGKSPIRNVGELWSFQDIDPLKHEPFEYYIDRHVGGGMDAEREFMVTAPVLSIYGLTEEYSVFSTADHCRGHFNMGDTCYMKVNRISKYKKNSSSNYSELKVGVYKLILSENGPYIKFSVLDSEVELLFDKQDLNNCELFKEDELLCYTYRNQRTGKIVNVERHRIMDTKPVVSGGSLGNTIAALNDGKRALEEGRAAEKNGNTHTALDMYQKGLQHYDIYMAGMTEPKMRDQYDTVLKTYRERVAELQRTLRDRHQDQVVGPTPVKIILTLEGSKEKVNMFKGNGYEFHPYFKMTQDDIVKGYLTKGTIVNLEVLPELLRKATTRKHMFAKLSDQHKVLVIENGETTFELLPLSDKKGGDNYLGRMLMYLCAFLKYQEDENPPRNILQKIGLMKGGTAYESGMVDYPYEAQAAEDEDELERIRTRTITEAAEAERLRSERSRSADMAPTPPRQGIYALAHEAFFKNKNITRGTEKYDDITIQRLLKNIEENEKKGNYMEALLLIERAIGLLSDKGKDEEVGRLEDKRAVIFKHNLSIEKEINVKEEWMKRWIHQKPTTGHQRDIRYKIEQKYNEGYSGFFNNDDDLLHYELGLMWEIFSTALPSDVLKFEP